MSSATPTTQPQPALALDDQTPVTTIDYSSSAKDDVANTQANSGISEQTVSSQIPHPMSRSPGSAAFDEGASALHTSYSIDGKNTPFGSYVGLLEHSIELTDQYVSPKSGDGTDKRNAPKKHQTVESYFNPNKANELELGGLSILSSVSLKQLESNSDGLVTGSSKPKDPYRVTLARSVKKAVFSKDGTNVVFDPREIEKVCDLKRCELKDKELERKFQESRLVLNVKKNATLSVIGVLYDLVPAIAGYFYLRFLPHMVVQGLYSSVGLLLTYKFSDSTKFIRVIYNYATPTVVVVFLVTSFLVSFFANIIPSTDRADRANSCYHLLNLNTIACSFIVLQSIQYRVRVLVPILATVLLVQIIALLIINPYFSSPKAMPGLVMYLITIIKSSFMIGVIRYRTSLSQRFLFQQSGFVSPTISSSPWRLMRLSLSKDFRSFQDKIYMKSCLQQAFLILAIDFFSSLIGIISTSDISVVYSHIKIGCISCLISALLVLWKLFLSERISTDLCSLVITLIVFLDSLAFFLDAALSVSTLGPETIDEGIVKTGVFFAVQMTNLIGFGSSGIRLPWSLIFAMFQVILAGLILPVMSTMLDFDSSTIYRFTYEFLLLFALLTLVCLLESWGLNMMYIQSYEIMKQKYQETLPSPEIQADANQSFKPR